MTANYLEELAAEWYGWRGYFVRRNVSVAAGEGEAPAEITLVAWAPDAQQVLHVEAFMDAHSWEQREERCRARFDAGREYLATTFPGFGVDRIVLLGVGSNLNHPELGGGRVVTMADFVVELLEALRTAEDGEASVPAHYPMLRTLQVVAEHRREIVRALIEGDPRQFAF